MFTLFTENGKDEERARYCVESQKFHSISRNVKCEKREKSNPDHDLIMTSYPKIWSRDTYLQFFFVRRNAVMRSSVQSEWVALIGYPNTDVISEKSRWKRGRKRRAGRLTLREKKHIHLCIITLRSHMGSQGICIQGVGRYYAHIYLQWCRAMCQPATEFTISKIQFLSRKVMSFWPYKGDGIW